VRQKNKESEILRRASATIWRHNPKTLARYTALRFSSVFSSGFPSSAIRLFPNTVHIPWFGSIKLLQLNEQYNTTLKRATLHNFRQLAALSIATSLDLGP
jgi:hypothetical protein